MSSDLDPVSIAKQVFEGPSSQPLRSDEASRLRAQIAALVDEEQIAWEERADLPLYEADGTFDEGTRQIVTPLVTSELGYFVALHEIGHIVLQLCSFGIAPDEERPPRLYLNEAEVWEWTVDASLIVPSVDAAEKMRLMLSFFDDPGEGREEALARLDRKVAEAQSEAKASPE